MPGVATDNATQMSLVWGLCVARKGSWSQWQWSVYTGPVQPSAPPCLTTYLYPHYTFLPSQHVAVVATHHTTPHHNNTSVLLNIVMNVYDFENGGMELESINMASDGKKFNYSTKFMRTTSIACTTEPQVKCDVLESKLSF